MRAINLKSHLFHLRNTQAHQKDFFLFNISVNKLHKASQLKSFKYKIPLTLCDNFEHKYFSIYTHSIPFHHNLNALTAQSLSIEFSTKFLSAHLHSCDLMFVCLPFFAAVEAFVVFNFLSIHVCVAKLFGSFLYRKDLKGKRN